MPRHQPTVDDHCSPGNPLGFVAGEEERHVGDVRRMAGALNGMQLRQYLLDHLRVGGQKVENGRIDTAGHMQLTRILSFATSSATERVRLTIPALAAL